MPFVWDCGLLPEPPTKRRKLSPRMARYSTPRSDDIEEQFLFEPAEPLEECSGPQERDRGGEQQDMVRTSDREELIQCIKRGQRITWVPKPGLEALYAEVNAEQNTSPSASMLRQSSRVAHTVYGQNIEAEAAGASARSSPTSASDALRRSLIALRTGDRFEDLGHRHRLPSAAGEAEALTPPRQIWRSHYDESSLFWQAGSPPIPSLQYQQSCPANMVQRSRAPSLGSSLSSSFVMRIPTSPLVQATNNPSLDFSPSVPTQTETSKLSRRRTIPPHAFDLHMPPSDSDIPNFSRPLPRAQPANAEGSRSSLGHRPRRSLSSFTYQPATTPQRPSWNRQRRLSLAADTPSRHRASMVGSFEESILRGRMSTPSSKPLDFVAQIGVMGKDNCPPSLKCPAHVTVPFPAVFYNYPSASSSRSISDDNPSPYVGNIDLEHYLRAPEEPRRRSPRSRGSLKLDELADEITRPENTAIGRALAHGTRHKQEKTAIAPWVPPGGAYRVPQKGQLQVIIKNPNKTAVKLFLVPYDLEGMLPGTKTFVRQRSYSSGPILETSSVENQAEIAARDPLSAKEILRYLIHLKFCCAAKGRYYLYNNIRVVFANRVPDGKDKLRNEVQLPEPKFSPYFVGSHSQSLGASDEKSSALSQPSVTPDFGKTDDIMRPASTEGIVKSATESPPISFHLNAPPRYDTGSANLARDLHGEEPIESQVRSISPVSGFLPSTSARGSPVPWLASNGSPVARSFSPTPVEAGHGLLSQKLREFGGNLQRRNE